MTEPVRRRDAARTRQALLDVAGRRFARDGYAATTVRDIADEAGVNVALINRYFTSKEGLFEACLSAAVADLRRESLGLSADTGLGAAMAHRVAGATGGQALHDTLLLLLRSSGDTRVDEIRREVLRTVSERLASVTGDHSLLHAEIVVAAVLGVTLVRSSLGVEPLASATEEELAGPLSELVAALLPARR